MNVNFDTMIIFTAFVEKGILDQNHKNQKNEFSDG